MDKTTQQLASYVASLSFDQLPEDAVRQAKKCLIDAVGCGIGGYSSEPVAIARRIAACNTGQPAASVLGSGALTSMEMAAFVNTSMVRYLDCNDTFISKGSGHPSDMIPACLAVAEAHRASGRDTLASIAAAYEVFTGLADVVNLREHGWDQGLFVVLGSAAGAAKLLHLTTEQTGNALAIAVSSNVATRQTRSGELSMWKGCATAAATRAGVFAALLAREGMTGPTAAFEGRHGVWDQVTGPFELGRLGGEGGAFGIERINFKYFPSEYHSQAPLWMALDLRSKVRVEEIETIDVQTYHMAYSEIGSEPEKWDPQTRETADHSLPYLLALALTDGRITADSFSPKRMQDPELRQLMRRIRIAENPEFTRQFPSKMVTEIEVQTRSGRRLAETASYPKGHAMNPMSEAEIESKFAELSENVLTSARRESILRALWDVDQAADIGKVIEPIRVDK